jgi:hypothetical protein
VIRAVIVTAGRSGSPELRERRRSMMRGRGWSGLGEAACCGYHARMTKQRRDLDPAALRELRAQARTGPGEEESRKALDDLPAAMMELVAELGELAAEGERLRELARRRGIKIPPDLQRDLDELGRAAGGSRP